MRPISILLLFMVSIIACKQKKASPATPNATEITILPYASMLLGEVKTIEDTPHVVYQYTLDKNSTVIDSTKIDLPTFKKLVTNFTEPNIADETIKDNYTQNSFEDLASGSYNFSYETSNAALPVSRVIVSFGKAEQPILKSLQLTKFYNKNSSTTLQQLYWLSNHYFTISTSTDSNHTETVRTIKVAWRPVL
jgi:hypothetical protein